MIELRPARADEVGPICALINKAEHHDGVPRVLSQDELREDLERPYVDLGLDTRVALRDAELAGWAWVCNPPAQVRRERIFLLGEVAPDHRGQGVGRELLAWSLERARARLHSRTHSLPKYICVAAYDWIEANHRLYTRFGFTPVRWFEELIRPLTGLPTVPIPTGAVILPWPDDREEEIRAARNAAFEDHWGSEPVDAESWQISVRGHGGRPDISVIAIDRATDEVVGVCLNHAYPEDNKVAGVRQAWISNLATVGRWRGRGLASAMIAESLEKFTSAGFTYALIGVDADNPTGAARLYRALGFQPLHRSIAYQIEMPDPRSTRSRGEESSAMPGT